MVQVGVGNRAEGFFPDLEVGAAAVDLDHLLVLGGEHGDLRVHLLHLLPLHLDLLPLVVAPLLRLLLHLLALLLHHQLRLVQGLPGGSDFLPLVLDGCELACDRKQFVRAQFAADLGVLSRKTIFVFAGEQTKSTLKNVRRVHKVLGCPRIKIGARLWVSTAGFNLSSANRENLS